MKKEKGAGLISLALALVGHKNYRILKKVSKNCARSAEKTLRGILEYAKDSEWGKAHNFAQILAAKTDKELLYRLIHTYDNLINSTTKTNDKELKQLIIENEEENE